ncbi:hypothetical protein RI367_008197 [Sorochytrium milnesiophthora]
MAIEKRLHPAVYIATWIFFSSSVILYNKYILTTINFDFPIFLTTWHQLFATVVTQVLARYTDLLPAAKSSKMTWQTYVRSVVPIGVVFSGSLIYNNFAYLSLSVSFIQMLKACTPMVVLLLSWSFGLGEPSMKVFLNILAVVTGVVIATFGEIQFVLNGFIFQALGIIFESTRLVLVQSLMTEKMDPLSSLYFFAPVCAVVNTVCFFVFEYSKISMADISNLGAFNMLANASVAFMLNVALVLTIGCTSSLVLTLCGVLKDILLIALSMIFFGSRTTMLQVFGYSVALTAMTRYKTQNIDWRKEYQKMVGKDKEDLPR